jgi:uncharacterized protein DUF6653
MGGPATDTKRGNRVTRAFGLKGDVWLRHANPASVLTRFAILPMLALSIWSRDWIGWWCLVPIALSIAWLVVNPMAFPEPASTRHWASRSVLGERVWTEGDKASFPAAFRSPVPAVATAFQLVGAAVLIYGLVVLDPIATALGIVIAQLAKLWYLDRMVLLFDAMKSRKAEYAAWDF